MIRRYLPKDTEQLIRWYERYVSPVALVAGFVADTLYLTRRVDLWQTNALLGSYLVLAACGIIILNAAEAGRIRSRRALALVPFVPIVVQFSFGGLFSGYLSLYSRSAAFAGSWVFIAVVAALLLGNERFMRFYRRVPFQISLYFVVLYSFFTFFFPIVFHSLGTAMFIAAGVASVALVAALIGINLALAPARMRLALPDTARSLAVILVAFNVLYFGNLIPPLPLSLKEAGVYHGIARAADGSYEVLAEPVPWWESFLQYNTVFHLVPGEDVYVFSAIFAPSGISAPIAYEWQYEEGGAWRTVSVVSLSIVGGRDGGFRSYSILSSAAAGSWRVNVLTRDGRLIGRIPFTVKLVASAPALAKEVR